MSEPDDTSPRPAGVREVAAHAGVSTQTVSRVLNGHANIRSSTRQRVLEAIEALGYRVNNAARSLGTRESRTIGLIASDAALYGPSAGIAAVEAAARAAGRWVAAAYAPAEDEASMLAALEHLRAQGVDGILLVAPHARTLQTLVAADPGLPVIALHGGSGADRQAAGVGLVVDHLVRLGHRRIAELAGPDDWLEAAARSRGLRWALTTHDLTAVGRWEGDWSAAAGHVHAEEIAAAVARDDGPTAIVVANDQMALGLIAGLRSLGVEVPGDVSVSGFDDNPDAAFYRPALTTVRLDIAGEARQCVGAVLGDLEPPTPEGPELIPRASTAAPRS
ncbi:LacI family DNA-binding transcriptional regulator [Microbacterium sp. P05]|uniref:LacI family DNA-binding transcriptional regulator n=1 Tax=Microbacterium sp. P05 TaxID=3366948 RepID=UPI003745DAD2